MNKIKNYIVISTLSLITACATSPTANQQIIINSVVAGAKSGASTYINNVISTGTIKPTNVQAVAIASNSLFGALNALNSQPSGTIVASVAPIIAVTSTADPAGQTAVTNALSKLPIGTTTNEAAIIISQAATNLVQ